MGEICTNGVVQFYLLACFHIDHAGRLEAVLHLTQEEDISRIEQRRLRGDQLNNWPDLLDRPVTCSPDASRLGDPLAQQD